MGNVKRKHPSKSSFPTCVARHGSGSRVALEDVHREQQTFPPALEIRNRNNREIDQKWNCKIHSYANDHIYIFEFAIHKALIKGTTSELAASINILEKQMENATLGIHMLYALSSRYFVVFQPT